MIFVVTDPYMGCAVRTDAELKSIVSVREWKQIAKLAVGEYIALRRDFGNRELQISRTEEN